MRDHPSEPKTGYRCEFHRPKFYRYPVARVDPNGPLPWFRRPSWNAYRSSHGTARIGAERAFLSSCPHRLRSGPPRRVDHPARGAPMTGVRMSSQERDGRTVYRIETPRVGVDGLAEALRARHGQVRTGHDRTVMSSSTNRRFGRCSHCGRLITVRRDGTIHYHVDHARPTGLPRHETCTGVGKPPRAESNEVN